MMIRINGNIEYFYHFNPYSVFSSRFYQDFKDMRLGSAKGRSRRVAARKVVFLHGQRHPFRPQSFSAEK